MKANEAPERLYLYPTTNGNVAVSWLTFPLTNEDIEYTRTDVFIERACEWIRDNYLKYPNEDCADTKAFVMDFKKYMKGE